MTLRSIFSKTAQKHERLASQAVVPDPLRCVQCGICSFNCPLGIDVRLHALQGLAVVESKCLTCGECVKRCPYNLPIPEMLHEYLALYDSHRAAL